MLRRIAIALGALLLLVAVAIGYVWWQANQVLAELHAGPKQAVVNAVEPELHRQPRHVLVPTTAQPPKKSGDPAPPTVDKSAQTILLVGSDHRYGQGAKPHSDTILLVRVDPQADRIALLSIPRDLYVDIPGHGHDRINEAFHFGGEKLLTRTVREVFGLEIDHFVEVDFHGFKDLVSALGGVYVPIDQRYYNKNVGTAATNYSNIDLQPGYQKLDGQQALAFARFRHTDSDLVRASRQQLLLREATRQVLKHEFDVFTLRRLAGAFAKDTTSDISSLGEAWTLLNTARRTPSSRLVRITLPATPFVLYGADYVRSTRTQMKCAIEHWLGMKPQPDPEAKPKPKAKAVKPKPAKPRPKPTLVPDGGRGAALVRSVRDGIRTCAPSALPPQYWWPQGWAARSYVLNGHPAIALAATRASGHSLLWMFTTWQNPPILDHPTRTLKRGGRTYRVYEEPGGVRQVAWTIGPTQAWLTNTLQDDLSARQLIALASSCR